VQPGAVGQLQVQDRRGPVPAALLTPVTAGLGASGVGGQPPDEVDEFRVAVGDGGDPVSAAVGETNRHLVVADRVKFLHVGVGQPRLQATHAQQRVGHTLADPRLDRRM
jgi:hypothetical protein